MHHQNLRDEEKLSTPSFFKHDNKYSDFVLLLKNYGPAKMKKKKVGEVECHEYGWLFLISLAEASRGEVINKIWGLDT